MVYPTLTMNVAAALMTLCRVIEGHGAATPQEVTGRTASMPPTENNTNAYILVSKKGQAQYDTYKEAASAYEALEDNRGAYIRRVKE